MPRFFFNWYAFHFSAINLQISFQLTLGIIVMTIECFSTNWKVVVTWDFRATQKCLYLEKYLFVKNKIFIFLFVFSISNSLRKNR